MRRAATIVLFLFSTALAATAQNQLATGSNSSYANSAVQSAPPTQAQQVYVDGIAAHIGNDVVTESEVRELEDYQKLLEGRAQSRSKVVQELVNQWIVHSEAAAIKFPQPASADVTREFQALLKHFSSREQFQRRLAAVNLTQDELLHVLKRQIYYVRFLDYKFHAAAQVTSAQIEAYYEKDLAPHLQKRGASVPALTQVEAQIRQLLTQEQINEKATQWLEEAKSRLRIVIQPSGGGG